MLPNRFEDLLVRIRNFDHPGVDPAQTEVISEAGRNGSFSVAVKLYDYSNCE